MRKLFEKNDPRINRKGRPKGSGNFSLVTIIKKELQQVPPEFKGKKGKEKKTYAELLVKKILHKAIIEGDSHLIKMLVNYIDGMPKESVDMNIENNQIAVIIHDVKRHEKLPPVSEHIE